MQANQPALEKKSATRKVPPYLLYGLLVGGILFARAFDLATQGTEWSIQIYNSVFWFRTLLLLAVVASSFAAFYFKRHMPPLLAWLGTGVVGGISMMLVNSIPGALLGLLIGAVVIATEPCASIVSHFGRTIVPSMLAGFLTGAIVALTWLHFGAPLSGVSAVLSIAIPVLVGLVVGVRTLKVTFPQRRWYGWLGAATLFVAFGLFGLIWAFTSKVESIRNSVPTVTASSQRSEYLLYNVFPNVTTQQLRACRTIDRFLVSSGLPYPGRYVVDLNFHLGSTAADIERASRLPFVTSVSVDGGCSITDEQFQQIDSRFFGSLQIGEDTKLTANALRDIQFSRMYYLTLEGQQFGDEVLPLINGTTGQFTLNLRGTGVTSEGLKKLKARVVLLELGNTQVDDRVFAELKRFTALQWLDLSGTQITGKGIENLPPTVSRLDLSNTQFDSDYLLRFVKPTEKNASLPLNTLFVSDLDISHTPFKSESTDDLLQVANTLTAIKVAGLADLPSEFFEQVKTPRLSLDGARLDTESIQRLQSIDLVLHYDAAATPVVEIVSRYRELQQAWEKSVAAKAPIGGPDPSLALVVENLELTRESIAAFGRHTYWQGGELRFHDARMKNRKVPARLEGVAHVQSLFPELTSDEEE